MPQRPIPDYWKEQVFSEVSLLEQEGQRVSDKAIEGRLRNHAKDLWKSSSPKDRELARTAPSSRSIGRIRKNEWEPKAESEKAQYRYFYWPESMGTDGLPWEASAAVLELRRFLDRKDQSRPTIRQAKWFWRLTQVAEDAPFEYRHRWCQNLAAAEVIGVGAEGYLRAMELELIHRPWKSEINHFNHLLDPRRSKLPMAFLLTGGDEAVLEELDISKEWVEAGEERLRRGEALYPYEEPEGE